MSFLRAIAQTYPAFAHTTRPFFTGLSRLSNTISTNNPDPQSPTAIFLKISTDCKRLPNTKITEDQHFLEAGNRDSVERLQGYGVRVFKNNPLIQAQKGVFDSGFFYSGYQKYTDGSQSFFSFEPRKQPSLIDYTHRVSFETTNDLISLAYHKLQINEQPENGFGCKFDKDDSGGCLFQLGLFINGKLVQGIQHTHRAPWFQRFTKEEHQELTELLHENAPFADLKARSNAIEQQDFFEQIEPINPRNLVDGSQSTPLSYEEFSAKLEIWKSGPTTVR